MSALRPLAALTVTVMLLLGSATPSLAVQPDEVLGDPALEKRARALSAGLRCVVCQNQSIDDSDAPLAGDLRRLVRERLVAGDTDGEIIDVVVARYGEFVLLRPRFGWHTAALWLAPALLLMFAVWTLVRRRAGLAAQPAATTGAGTRLTAREEAELDKLLSNDR
ncbi:MAG: cytochrome c-type biogenesis protein [Pseudomonadota bacterium]